MPNPARSRHLVFVLGLAGAVGCGPGVSTQGPLPSSSSRGSDRDVAYATIEATFADAHKEEAVGLAAYRLGENKAVFEDDQTAVDLHAEVRLTSGYRYGLYVTIDRTIVGQLGSAFFVPKGNAALDLGAVTKKNDLWLSESEPGATFDIDGDDIVDLLDPDDDGDGINDVDDDDADGDKILDRLQTGTLDALKALGITLDLGDETLAGGQEEVARDLGDVREDLEDMTTTTRPPGAEGSAQTDQNLGTGNTPTPDPRLSDQDPALDTSFPAVDDDTTGALSNDLATGIPAGTLINPEDFADLQQRIGSTPVDGGLIDYGAIDPGNVDPSPLDDGKVALATDPTIDKTSAVTGGALDQYRIDLGTVFRGDTEVIESAPSVTSRPDPESTSMSDGIAGSSQSVAGSRDQKTLLGGTRVDASVGIDTNLVDTSLDTSLDKTAGTGTQKVSSTTSATTATNTNVSQTVGVW